MSAELLSQEGQDLIRCYDPRDLTETERIVATSVEQVPAMAAAARSAQAGWAAMGLAARKAAIARVRRRISRFLSAEGVLRRLKQRLDDVP